MQTAVRDALGNDAARAFVRLADEPKDFQPCPANGIRVVVLVMAGGNFGSAMKRKLFGRIAELSWLELDIAHDEIVTGIVETPRENWSTGYDERQWRQYLAFQLP